MKAKLSAAVVLGGLLLIGGGCNKQPAAPADAGTMSPDTNASSTAMMPEETTPETDFTLTAVSETHGAVKTNWTTPASLPADASFRLLHSAQPNVEFPGRAFWTALTKEKSRLEWEGVPSGKRYFRICVLSKGACVQYSNEVEVSVK